MLSRDRQQQLKTEAAVERAMRAQEVKRQKTQTDATNAAQRSVPVAAWALGVSILSLIISAATFLWMYWPRQHP